MSDETELILQTQERIAKQKSRIERFNRFDLDVRGLLAIVTVIAFFGVVFIQLFQGKTIAIPAEVAAVVTGVAGFYFGSRGGGDSNGKPS